MRLLSFFVLVASLELATCKTANSSGIPGGPVFTPNHPIEAGSMSSALPSSGDIDDMRDAFFARPAEEEEVYRVFVTSEGYTRKQVAHSEDIALKEDKAGDQAIANEIGKYDMVNSLQEGQLRVELYPTSGKFYRVRQTKPSIMKESDRIFSDDITRWQFQFPKGQIVPKDFRVSYQVLLRKKISREQAHKILTDQNNKKKK